MQEDLSSCGFALSVPCKTFCAALIQTRFCMIHQAIIRGNFGKVSEVKDFLNPLKKGNVILRSVNGVRRRGIAIYMASLPVPMQQKLWKCEYSQEWEIVVVVFFLHTLTQPVQLQLICAN